MSQNLLLLYSAFLVTREVCSFVCLSSITNSFCWYNYKHSAILVLALEPGSVDDDFAFPSANISSNK